MSAPETSPRTHWQTIKKSLSLPAAFGLAVWVGFLLHSHVGATREASFMGGIFVLAAVLWVTEALPLFATSLLVIGLQIIFLSNPGGWHGLGFEQEPSPTFRDLLSVAADPVLVLFFGGFVLAHAAVKTGVDRAMSSVLLRPFGGEPRWLLLGVMLVTLLFGMWMSNTATTAMMLALVTPLLAALPPGEPFRKALVLGVPFAANISGMATPISSPPNAVAMGFLQKSGYAIPFFDWVLMATPFTIGLTLLAWFLLWKTFKPVTPGLKLAMTQGKLSRNGWVVVVVFVVTVVLWMTDVWHGLPASVVALLPAVVLTVTTIFTRADLAQLEWNVLILIAGGISLGTGMQLTGLDRVIVGWLPAPEQNDLILLVVLVAATLVVGTFMSNTAAANLFLPIGLSSTMVGESASGLHPVHIAVSIALVASMSMALPVSTPPNAMAYARGEFTTREMVRVSLFISLAGMILILLGTGLLLRLFGLMPAH